MNAINSDNDKGTDEVSERKGLRVWNTTLLLAGEMAGAGVLALPLALHNTGWIGMILLPVCCALSGYSGINLSRCLSIVYERYPDSRSHSSPYPLIANKAAGIYMQYVVSVAMDVTLFGVCIIMLLMTSQNLQAMFGQAGWDMSYCIWLLGVGACMIPLSWLATPKDFWGMALAAAVSTALASILIATGCLMRSDAPYETIVVSPPSIKTLSLGFGAILFAFGGASTFPTIQKDMKNPKQFPVAVIVAYCCLLAMYMPVAIAGAYIYGDQVKGNILINLEQSNALTIIAQVLITTHLFSAFIIAINPVSQDLEHLLRIPPDFGWKRCVLRTGIVVVIIFIAETVPTFGPILDLIGGSTVTFLTFVAPSLFLHLLSRETVNFPKIETPLYIRVLNIEIICIGIVGGIASTYAAISEIITQTKFNPPCYV